MAPRIEPSPNRRAKCRVCYAQIDKAVLRVGTEAMSEWGPTTQWHHMSCLNLSKHVKSAAELAGFAELSGAHQAEVLGHFNGGGAASASAPPTPARPTPKKAAPKEARPEQIAEKAPLERGICAIEYAKAQKPSPCMICKGKIANGEPRVGDRQPSPYYEGLQTRWLCLSCALSGRRVLSLTQLCGWDRMGYDANREIREATGELLVGEKEAELERMMAPLEGLTDEITANLSVDALVGALRLNGIDVRALTIERDTVCMAHVLADAMLNGVAADCPVCEMAGLHFAAGRIACLGHVENLSRCPYRCAPDKVARYRCKLPQELLDSDWLAAWRADADGAPANGKGKKGGKRKAAAMSRSSVGSRALAGLELAQPKPSDTPSAAPTPRKPPPTREAPQPFSPILEVHRGYRQTGLYGSAKVLVDDDGVTVYNAHLMQVDVATRVNRYYIVQALAVGGTFEVFCHWGATGREEEEEVGGARWRDNYQRYPQPTKQAAIDAFKGWFAKKTNWSWDDRHNFRQTPKWYNFVELSTHDPRASKPGAGSAADGAGPTKPCALDAPVAELVELLFDADTILNSMSTNGIRVDDNFGIHSVTAERVERAHGILSRLVQLLKQRPPPLEPAAAAAAPAPAPAPACRGARARKPTKKQLEKAQADAARAEAERVDAHEQAERVWRAKVDALSNDFQQTIPAVDPVRLDTDARLEEKAKLLDTLSDIALAQQLLKKGQAEADSAAAAASAEPAPHPLDVKYQSLKCELRALADQDPVSDAVRRAVRNTASTLRKYEGHLSGFRMRTRAVGSSSRDDGAWAPEVLGVFALEREGERERYEPYTELGNCRLLWHGTDVSSAAAIVSSGLRIMPSSGGRVGKGIYLAEEVNKSGWYVTPSASGEAIMFLAEAALGHPASVQSDNPSLKKAPPGHDSCVTTSCTMPDPAHDVQLDLDARQVTFATGPIIEPEPPAAAPGAGSGAGGAKKQPPRSPFVQKEYLVYRESQVRLRYLVKLRI